VTTSDEGSRTPEGPGRGVRWRLWFYTAAALSLIVAALAVVQWFSANDSQDRWRAGVQGFLAVAVAIGFLVQARSNSDK
jgi:membrane protein YdbS with pleckstrin-like domain